MSPLLELDTKVVDFGISLKDNYNFLVVLTNLKLLFFHLENLQLQ